MTTIKVKFRKSKVRGKMGTVYYQICHRQRTAQINPNIHIKPTQWDHGAGRIRTDQSNSSKMRLLHMRIRDDLNILNHIINRFESARRQYTPKDVVDAFATPVRHSTVTGFFYTQIATLNANGRLSTARNYQNTLNSFIEYTGDEQIALTMLTADVVTGYNKWLMERGVMRNTLSFYMRIMRAVYNKAVKRGLVTQTFPFRNVYTGVDRTKKRAVDEQVVLKLIQFGNKHSNNLVMAKDIFLFSFYTCGMAFIDIAYLRRENVTTDAIVYTRRKTGQQLSIPMEPCIADIIRYYEPMTRKSQYLFPILTAKDPVIAYRQYHTALGYYNRTLKKLSCMMGLPVALTSYTARHTWATMARNCRVPLAVISACMGHTSEKTTQIYLDSINNTLKSKANQSILDFLEKERNKSYIM